MTNKQKTPEIIEIDMRGQVCPACLLVALDKMNKHRDPLNQGLEELYVKTDNREATTTIPTTARNMGYSVTVNKLESYYLICVGQFSQESKK